MLLRFVILFVSEVGVINLCIMLYNMLYICFQNIKLFETLMSFLSNGYVFRTQSNNEIFSILQIEINNLKT